MKADKNEMRRIIETVVDGYIQAVYFTDTGRADDDQPAETIEPSRAFIIRAYLDCADFLLHCEDVDVLRQYADTGRTWDSFGIDFWLTRNGHGAGFWDRGMGELGDALTEAAETHGRVDAYKGDDGMFYFA